MVIEWNSKEFNMVRTVRLWGSRHAGEIAG